MARNGAWVAKQVTGWPKLTKPEAKRRRGDGEWSSTKSSQLRGLVAAIWPALADFRESSLVGAKMDAVYAMPVFHVGGRLMRNAEGELVYEGVSVEKFEKMDVDLLNFGDFLKLLEDELGYKTKKKLRWWDCAEEDLGAGLYELTGHKEINEMCENILRNFGLVEEFHIYVEHEVSVPQPAKMPPAEPEPIVIDSEDSAPSSTNDGGYENAGDELYKPPKVVSEEDDTDSDGEGSNRKL
ncbi:hypothetical protein PIB30_036906 [Stylosanthes scabra]|uniref:PB1-like domain-containing protein n=1 Tax=Stylosanthes scabra TaxID=79078 RepID=A0ABU6ZC22_9FABA|nr:hypothetical protein [Stylosanthes scabra]